jgi:phage terminase small subunit
MSEDGKQKLTEKQKQFADLYLSNGYKPLDAYFEAFPDADKSNKHPSYPYTLLKLPQVKEYIEQRRQEIYESLNIDAYRIAERLAEIGFADKEDKVYNVGSRLKALELLQKQLGLQNQKIETKQEIIEVSLED